MIITGYELRVQETNYIVSENILQNSLGLLICVTLEDVLFPFTLSAVAEDGTAQRILNTCTNNVSVHI